MFLKDRSTRTVLAALFASAAGILGVNLVIRPEGLADSMGPTFALLLGVAIVLWAWNWRESYVEAHPHVEDADDADTDALPMSAAAPIAAVSVAPEAAPEPAAPAPALVVDHAPEAAVVSAPPVAAPEPEPPAPAPVVDHAPEAAAVTAPPVAAPEPEPPAPVIEHAPPASAVAAPPPAPAKPAKAAKVSKAEAVPDDFTKIEGIGKYYNEALHKIGYQSFAALAGETPEAILAKLLGAGYRRHPTIPTWPEQAGFAARGDWDGLGRLQATLISGRKAED